MEHKYNFNKKNSFFTPVCFFLVTGFFSSSSYKKFHAEHDGSIEPCTPHLRLNMLNK